MKRASGILLVLTLFVRPMAAGEVGEIHGRVIDWMGKPVAGASVDYFWRANGPKSDKDGKPVSRVGEEALKEYWGQLGQMEPLTAQTMKTGNDGRFSMKLSETQHTLMAMDARRSRGGLAVIDKGKEDSPVEIRVGPLVRVRGSFAGPEPGMKPEWTHIYALLPEDPTRPLDDNELVSCGSYDARFEMSLPPGRYFLYGYDERDSTINREVILKTESPDVDLGVLMLSRNRKSSIVASIEQSQATGAMGDYTKNYGKKLGNWHIVDARGVSKNVQISDFKGKWVLLHFWGLNCRPCLKDDLPRLARFYHEHQEKRERFEILAMCIDVTSELKSIADLDRKLEPIVKHVWDGKAVPFPLLIDPSMRTLEGFGVPGYFTLLIDPEGRLIEGDETVLAES